MKSITFTNNIWNTKGERKGGREGGRENIQVKLSFLLSLLERSLLVKSSLSNWFNWTIQSGNL